MPVFYTTGTIEPSKNGRSFKVYALIKGEKVFVGLVQGKSLSNLLHHEIPICDICKFSQNGSAEQESIDVFPVMSTPRQGATKP